MSPLNGMPEVDHPEFKNFFESRDLFALKIGYRLVSVTPGKSEYYLDVDESFNNPMKIVHGGALFSAMDSAAGAAITSYLKDREVSFHLTATATIEMRYRKPILNGRMKVTAEVTEHKRSLVRLMSKAFDAQGELVAELKSTWIIK